MPHSTHFRQHGFSLIEVMLVLALVGLFMGVVASNLSEGPVLREASREVIASLRQARSVAIMQQKQTRWVVDIDRKTFWIEAPKPTERTLASAVNLKVNTAASEVISKSQGAIRFFPDGSSTGGSIEVSQKGQAFKVNVEWVSGRVDLD